MGLPKKLPVQNLPAGRVLHRVFDPAWPIGSFNSFADIIFKRGVPHKEITVPSGKKVVKAYTYRFSPFTVDGKTAIGTLYAGLTEEDALCETLVRVNDPNCPMLLWDQMLGRKCGQLVVNRKLHLATLFEGDFGSDPDKYPLNYLDVSDPSCDKYDMTTELAAEIHQHTDKVDGLMWYSTRNDTHRSVVLFRDRVTGEDIKNDTRFAHEDVTSKRVLKEIFQLCNMLGYPVAAATQDKMDTTLKR